MKNKQETIISFNDVIVKTNTRGKTLNVIKNISFDVYANEILAIVGKSNTGKTVLTKVLSNSLNQNSYVSNGTIMYYPTKATIDEGKDHILSPIDLVSYQKSNLSNVTKNIITLTNKTIIDKAVIKIYKLRQEISKIQEEEAHRQTVMFKSILDKTVRMSQYEKTQLHSSTYLKDKNESINNNTSPSMPLINKLLKRIQKHESAIDNSFLILASTIDQKEEIVHYKVIEYHKNEIKNIKLAISQIQISVAKTNYAFMKSLKSDIKFLLNNEEFLNVETRKASLKKMKYYNQILKLDQNEVILLKMKLIDDQLEIIRRANYELSNFKKLSDGSIENLSLLMQDIQINKDSIKMVEKSLIEDGLEYLGKKEFLTDFENNLINLVSKILVEKKVSKEEINKVLAQWNFQKHKPSKNRSELQKDLKFINEEVISTIFESINQSLKPNVKIGHQISDIISSTKRLSKSEAHSKALELLHRLGLVNAEEIFNMLPSECSDTINQLVVIAKSVSSSPKVLVWDETANLLGSNIKNQLLKLIIELKEELNLTVILFTQSFEIPSKIADRIAVIHDGEIVEYGNTKEIINNAIHPESIALKLNVKEIFQKENLDNISDNLFNNFNEKLLRKNYAEKNYVLVPNKFSKITKSHFIKEEFKIKARRGNQ
ncbi:ATP-binding cassette domain-containing protein [Mesoplasma corruscae]|uniref:Oligopeptide ABC transporter ATP-binding protein n=1 Tax=Mesoplasma corruscae TaxID=216874 RepID=A0A2S5RH18_9MOLU|nr:ATP-binding cassette domain-containing protein [Mesoplasma corruscae]PPE06587.1 oligopeptide ABC transporter ATP-binding protein [Mesoplasma corruscae]